MTNYCTRKQASEALNVSLRTIDRMRVKGFLKYIKDDYSKKVLITGKSVKDVLNGKNYRGLQLDKDGKWGWQRWIL